MAKRIPKHIMRDKIGEIRPNDKAIAPKGKKGSTGLEKQDRLIAQFMNIARRSRKPQEPTLLQKLILEGGRRKKYNTIEEKDSIIYAKGIAAISSDISEKNKKNNQTKLEKLLNSYNDSVES